METINKQALSKLPLVVLSSTTLLLVIQSILYFLVLPDEVAVHFGFNGEANNWSSKEAHFLFCILFSILFYIFWLIIPRLSKSLPRSMVNIPNADFWLSEENKPLAIKKIAQAMYIFGAGTNLLMICVFHLIFQINTTDKTSLGPFFIIVFTLYIVFTFMFIIWLYKIFKKPA